MQPHKKLGYSDTTIKFNKRVRQLLQSIMQYFSSGLSQIGENDLSFAPILPTLQLQAK